MNAKTDTSSVLGDIDGIEGTPDAIEAAANRRHRGLSMDPAAAPGRGVEWVRPTDLIARGGSRVAGAGIDFQRELVRRARSATSAHMHLPGHRARKLPPLSAFGRGGTDRGMGRGAVGMR